MSDFEILPPAPSPRQDIVQLLLAALGPGVEFDVEEQVDERYGPYGPTRTTTGLVRIRIRCEWQTIESYARYDEYDDVVLKMVAQCQEARGRCDSWPSVTT